MKKVFQIAIVIFACSLSANIVQAQTATSNPVLTAELKISTGSAVQGIVTGISGAENTPAVGVLMGTSTGAAAGGFSHTATQPAIGANEKQQAAAQGFEATK